MGYANPIERYDQRHGEGAFIAHAREAGVDGVLVVDYPPEECEAFAARLKAAGLDLIFLLAPTSTEQRMARGRPHRQRLRLLRVAEGRDRRRPPGHRRRGRDAAAHPRPREACRWAWASASATRPPRAPWRRWPTRW